MKSVKTMLCALALLAGTPALCLASSVVATGSGATVRLALKDAMRMAVEQEASVAVASRTHVANSQTLSDRIYTHAEGYISGYEILRQEQIQGQYFATIRAEVRDDVLNADLMTPFQKQAAVGGNLQDPRIGIIVLDPHGRENQQAENALIQVLHESGFSRIVDLAQMEQSMKHRVANAAFQNNFSLVQSLQTQFPVDYLITAKIGDLSDSQIRIQGFENFRTGRARMDIRMVNVNSAEIWYADSVYGTAMHSYGDMARVSAIDRMIEAARPGLQKALMRKAMNPEQHIHVIITNHALGTLSEACQRLSEIPGVNNVFPRNSNMGNMELSVDYAGTAGDFMSELEHYGIRVTEMTSEFIKI